MIILAGAALLAMGIMLPMPQASRTTTNPNAEQHRQQMEQPQTQPSVDSNGYAYEPPVAEYDNSAYLKQQQQMQENARQFEEDHWAWEEEQTRQQYIQEQNER